MFECVCSSSAKKESALGCCLWNKSAQRTNILMTLAAKAAVAGGLRGRGEVVGRRVKPIAVGDARRALLSLSIRQLVQLGWLQVHDSMRVKLKHSIHTAAEAFSLTHD